MMAEKSSSTRIMLAASLLTSVPVCPMAIPMSADFRATASFTPSPVMATIAPHSCKALGKKRQVKAAAPPEPSFALDALPLPPHGQQQRSLSGVSWLESESQPPACTSCGNWASPNLSASASPSAKWGQLSPRESYTRTAGVRLICVVHLH